MFHSYVGIVLGNRGPGGSQTDWLWQLREHYTNSYTIDPQCMLALLMPPRFIQSLDIFSFVIIL